MLAKDRIMRYPPLFRRKKHEGLPPSFLPSVAMPSITANASTIIPSVGDASVASPSLGSWIDASQSVGKALAHVSSASRDMAPVHVTCRDWNIGEIFEWYRRQQPYTTIGKLELRKEKDHFKHEYIVIYLDNGWHHRIERRPTQRNMETLSREGCEADDSLTPVSDAGLMVIRSETDAEVTLKFKSNKPDLYNVIAVAVAIHLDPQAKRYTLQQYNCYFVARSIIALVTRHYLLQVPMTGLQWDTLTESAIFNHIFDGNWNTLATVLKSSISTVNRTR
ncbi:hypothetical protein APHAL10511_003241 [Amanita phalloides]|nr:hypothetical protein APHAL10511_003241 [Amanita phalloides]